VRACSHVHIHQHKYIHNINTCTHRRSKSSINLCTHRCTNVDTDTPTTQVRALPRARARQDRSRRNRSARSAPAAAARVHARAAALPEQRRVSSRSHTLTTCIHPCFYAWIRNVHTCTACIHITLILHATYMRELVHACHANMRVLVLTNIHGYMLLQTHTYIHVLVHACVYTHTCLHTPYHTHQFFVHACMYTCMHAHTHHVVCSHGRNVVRVGCCLSTSKISQSQDTHNRAGSFGTSQSWRRQRKWTANRPRQ
jgi:hypothetical protein